MSHLTHRLHSAKTMSHARKRMNFDLQKKQKNEEDALRQEEEERECTFAPNLHMSNRSMQMVRKVGKKEQQIEESAQKTYYGKFEPIDVDDLVEDILKHGREAFKKMRGESGGAKCG